MLLFVFLIKRKENVDASLFRSRNRIPKDYIYVYVIHSLHFKRSILNLSIINKNEGFKTFLLVF